MKLISCMSYLSKFSTVVEDESVGVEFVLTHLSKNEPVQTVLDEFVSHDVGVVFRSDCWDVVRVPQYRTCTINFDESSYTAQLKHIKVCKKESKSGEITYKYDFVFMKKQEKDVDAIFTSYLKRKEDDGSGKRLLVNYVTEIIPTTSI